MIGSTPEIYFHTSFMNYTFFYGGIFSQWHPSPFKIGDETYNCAEQWMMASKAQMFSDKETWEKIMESLHPRDQKKLGRSVKNFNKETWERSCRQIVYLGNYAKFDQNHNLKEKLLLTKGTTLVEASPYDTIWGIGLGMTDPLRLDQKNWRGTNWLGQILTELRDDFIGNKNASTA